MVLFFKRLLIRRSKNKYVHFNNYFSRDTLPRTYSATPQKDISGYFVLLNSKLYY